MFFKDKFIPQVFYYDDKDAASLLNLYERLKNAYSVFKWKQNLLINKEPNDIDEQEIKIPDDGLQMMQLKHDLSTKFKVLDKQNFYSHIKSSQFTMVFFFLPCKNFLLNH